jgi:branched-chain amino acid transport system permease protein
MMGAREWLMLAALAVLIVVGGVWFKAPTTVQILVSALAYALIALGLNVQWGYGGLFNFGVMGFLMLGGYATVLVAYPINAQFWGSDGPAMLGRAALAAAIGAALILATMQVHRIGIKGRLRTFLLVVAWAIAYFGYRSQIDPAAVYIEQQAGFVGGLGLPVLLGWVVGGLLAGTVGFLIGKICLGLRTDYLAIATIGISEIVRALMKNMDWLTRGTLTVSPIPWPVPQQTDVMEWGASDEILALTLARSMYLAVTLIVIAILYVLLQRAYYGPWGRMMRAIRDNHVAAASMGKNVTRRQLEIFVIGSVLMGIGGAILTGYVQLYDPGGYQPINHTFIIWVMVIVGGAGNNLGALFGGVLIILVWNMSDPLSQMLFGQINDGLVASGLPQIPDVESRALQMRVFVLGLVIVLALRYAPRGLIPERILSREERQQDAQA